MSNPKYDPMDPTTMADPARVLIADAPWQLGDDLPGETRGAAKRYPCMPLHEIMRFPLPPLADDCLLVFWRLSSMVEEAYAVVRAWGFTPKSEIVWVKRTRDHERVGTLAPIFPVNAAGACAGAQRQLKADDELAILAPMAFGMGRIVRGAHETAIIATRGKFKAANLSQRTVFEAPLGAHSAKPDRFYEIVETLAEGPRAELFARRRRDGWVCFGNQLDAPETDTDAPAPAPERVPEISTAAPTPAADDMFGAHAGGTDPSLDDDDDLFGAPDELLDPTLATPALVFDAGSGELRQAGAEKDPQVGGSDPVVAATLPDAAPAGHPAATDPPAAPAAPTEAAAAAPAKRTTICGHCGQPGHNKRACPNKHLPPQLPAPKAPPAPAPALAAATPAPATDPLDRIAAEVKTLTPAAEQPRGGGFRYDRAAALAAGVRENLIPAELAASDENAAWTRLTLRAPAGWFKPYRTPDVGPETLPEATPPPAPAVPKADLDALYAEMDAAIVRADLTEAQRTTLNDFRLAYRHHRTVGGPSAALDNACRAFASARALMTELAGRPAPAPFKFSDEAPSATKAGWPALAELFAAHRNDPELTPLIQEPG